MNARELLSKAMSLITQDLTHIENMVKVGKLDKDSSNDLARYSTALLHIAKDKEADEDTKKKSLAKLTDEELAELARKSLLEFESPAKKGKKNAVQDPKSKG